MYLANEIKFYSYKDNYAEGQIAELENYWTVQLSLQADNLNDLFNKIKNKLSMNSSEYYWYYDTENQKLIVNYISNEDNCLATKNELELWKTNKIDLWSVEGYITLYKTLDITSDEITEFCNNNSIDMN